MCDIEAFQNGECDMPFDSLAGGICPEGVFEFDSEIEHVASMFAQRVGEKGEDRPRFGNVRVRIRE